MLSWDGADQDTRSAGSTPRAGGRWRSTLISWAIGAAVFAVAGTAGAAIGAGAPLAIAGLGMPSPMVLTFAIVIAAFVLFVTEVIPPDITALAAAAALMVTGVLTPEGGFSGFSNEATVTVLSMFILAAGVQRTGLINVMAHRVLDWTGERHGNFFLLLVALAGVVSAFINNTPVVAILIPLVITVAGSLGRSPSKFLIPLSYAAMLGGTMTLIGTSTNLLASGLSNELGYGAFTMFMFFKVGVVLLVVGILYLFFVGRYLLPERHEAEQLTERFRLREYVCEIVIQPGSPLVGQTVDRSDLRTRFDIDVMRIFRERLTIDQPLVGVELEQGDVLLVRASRDELLQMRDTEGIGILPEVTHGLPGEEGDVVLVEAIVTPGSILEGATLKETRFRQRYDAVVLAVKKRERLFLRRFGSLRLEPGDTLLLSSSADVVEALKQSPDLIIAEELETQKFRRERIPVVGAILVGMIAVVTLGWLPISAAALTAVLLMVLTGCLTVSELHESIRWDIVFLLAGVIPLGVALEATGGAAVIADQIAMYASNLPNLGTLAIVYLATVVLTQMMSNNASVALMLPVAVEVALALQLNPMTFILAVTFAGSMGFMTPIGYQTNMMVYGPGEYKFTDFARIGAPLTLIAMVVTLFLLNLYWPMV